MSLHLPPFLTLLFELRLEIYGIVLDQRLGFIPKFYLSISSVNRQIRREVLPIILSNNRYFSSLDKFSNWTAKGDPFLLKQIQNVTVHLFDDSLLQVSEALAGNPSDSTSSKSAARFWRTVSAPQFGRINIKAGGRNSLRSKLLYALSLSKIDNIPDTTKDAVTTAWDAFKAIKEVKKLWLLFKDSTHPSNRRSFPVEQELLLDIISSGCQQVQEFTVFSALVSLDYLRHFQNLRSLRFSGYSKSSPEETLIILQSLKTLNTLIIYRYPESYDIDNNIITADLPTHVSITPEVIVSMNPLKHFQVTHMSSVLPSLHISVPLLQALRNHLSTLRIFQLSSDYALTKDIVEELFSFLATSKITDLKI